MTNATGAPARLDTVPKLLLRNAQLHATRPAYREKALGIWQSWTWEQVRDEVRDLALGLSKLGLRSGDKLAIIGDNRPQLYWAFTAAQSLGAIPVPLYQDSVAREMAFVLSHAEVKMAIVEDQEQVDKLLSIAADVPTIGKIVYNDPRGLDRYDPTSLYALSGVQGMGRDSRNADPHAEEKWLAGVQSHAGSDISAILYTSGTTGQPKGVMLSHDNVVRSAENANRFDKLTAEDTMLAYLPMAWVGDHIFSYGQAYAAALCICCPESPDTAVEDRREIGPSFFFAPPRVFENMLTQVMVRMEDAGSAKRGMFKYFIGVAKRAGERMLDGKPVGFGDRILYRLGDALVYAPLRNRMGFSNLRVAYTAGEAIGPELFSFFRGLGINLKQLYGQTEATVFITVQPDGEVFADSVGKPAPEVDIRIAETTGEVEFKSPGVFVRYFKNDEATANTKTPDGWVKTGDAGFIGANGHLRIIDRAKDVGRLTDGTLFAPKYLENRIKFFPEIKEAVAFGHGRAYTTMFVNIDLTSVGNWAERNNVLYASYQELAAHPDVYAMIEKRVDELNTSLAAEPMVAGSQIKRFLILHKELDADDGELTRTLKVRRGFIADRYAPLLTALYDGSARCRIKTEVTFEDGRKGSIEGDVKIVDMKTYPPAQAPVLEAAE